MLKSVYTVDEQAVLAEEIRNLVSHLGKGIVEGVAYDTAWAARLAPRYPGHGFEASLEWLRRNQYDDGTWGAPLVHYHDRFISTLAAIVALREVGQGTRDERRIKRGEDALWRLVGRLGRDDSDTVGFPILSAALAREAATLGLDVPQPPVRFAGAYKKKVEALLAQTERNWRSNPLTFSLEALRAAILGEDAILEKNHSVAISPAATAAYALSHHNELSLAYLKEITHRTPSGATPALAPIDIFEVAWALSHLKMAGVVSPDDPDVRPLLDFLWDTWSPIYGVSYSTHFAVADADDTAACFSVLKWGGYPVDADVFAYYEMEDYFCCYHQETNPAVSAHVRLLNALRLCEDHPHYQTWINKVVGALRRFDENGSFWWDKWHSSPYYVNSTALSALQGVADDLAHSRYKWISRTQNDDGGWGYLGESTPEETAYCLEALLFWDRTVELVPSYILDAAAKYLWSHFNDKTFTPLWIGKSLYTPRYPVQASILGALAGYSVRGSL